MLRSSRILLLSLLILFLFFSGVVFIVRHSIYSLAVASNHRFVICCILCSTLAIVVNAVINIIAALPFYSDYDSPFLFTLLPGGSLMLFAHYITKPSVTKRSLCNRAFIVLLISTVVYLVLSYLITWITQDLVNLIDRVCLMSYVKHNIFRRNVEVGNMQILLRVCILKRRV